MSLPNDLGKLIIRDAKLMEKLGREDFVKQHRGRGNFARLGAAQHPT